MRDPAPSSRAINVDLPMVDVRAACERQSRSITAIETLLSGGTRVVMNDGDAAAQMRCHFKGLLISGPVQRAAWSSRRG